MLFRALPKLRSKKHRVIFWFKSTSGKFKNSVNLQAGNATLSIAGDSLLIYVDIPAEKTGYKDL